MCMPRIAPRWQFNLAIYSEYDEIFRQRALFSESASKWWKRWIAPSIESFIIYLLYVELLVSQI